MHWKWFVWSKKRCSAVSLHDICCLLFHICCLYGEWNSYTQKHTFFLYLQFFEVSVNPDAMKSMKWNTSPLPIKRQMIVGLQVITDHYQLRNHSLPPHTWPIHPSAPSYVLSDPRQLTRHLTITAQAHVHARRHFPKHLSCLSLNREQKATQTQGGRASSLRENYHFLCIQLCVCLATCRCI